MTPELEHHRDRMLAELHAHLTATYGTVNGGIRLARVVALCHDVGVRPTTRIKQYYGVMLSRPSIPR